jgi:hypothetical protein
MDLTRPADVDILMYVIPIHRGRGGGVFFPFFYPFKDAEERMKRGMNGSQVTCAQ